MSGWVRKKEKRFKIKEWALVPELKLTINIEQTMINSTLKNASILIVDDKEANIDILMGLLELEGYSNIKSTTDPRFVVKMVQAFNPDLVLLDLMMPHISGYEVMEQLKPVIPFGTFVPILVLTADITQEAKQRALAGGASDFLSKPFDLMEVALRIKNLLFTRYLFQQMQNQNQILEEKIKERTSELVTINSELMVAKDKAEASDRLKTAFINNISHEIRTPLNGILGFGEMIVNYDLSQKEKEEFLAVLKVSSDRLLNTVTDYMDIAFFVSGNVSWNETVFPPVNLLAEIVKKYTPACLKKNLELIPNRPPEAEAFMIRNDYILLKKALSHLVDNAIKFTKEGFVSFGFEIKEKELEFFVKDTGVGIGEESQMAIFEQFVQENSSNTRGFEGSGLGLTIAKEIVKLCGGRIWLHSVKGKGSDLYFTIPYVPAPQTKPLQEEPPKEEIRQEEVFQKPGRKLKILIAEDVEASEHYLTLALRKITQETFYATSGTAAVENCRLHPDLDLILMDIRMPELNGYDATKMIREFNKEVVIIAQTAYAELGDKEKAIQSGCSDFIAKPINQSILMEIIHKHLPNINED